MPWASAAVTCWTICSAIPTTAIPTRTSSSSRPTTPSTPRTSSGCLALDAAGDLLRTLAGRGWRIVLATSASGAELSALRRAIGADDVILGAAGAEDVADGKPAPDPVGQARELAGVPSERAVFVGDTVWDMEAALRDGVTPVAVLSGGIPRADLETAGAQAVYRDPADLLGSLDSSVFADGE